MSFLSPCVLPLLPIYIGYLSGGAKEYDRKRLMVNTVLFVLGISFVFFLLGLGVTGLSRFLVTNKRIIEIVGGILIVLLGLVQIFLYGRSGSLS
ncbi:MAG: cytochrome C biogenesis protein, partial [Firmicutes bacterium]|nr:cytochrome C biogenesis protein [Bacillota bacterium]